MPKGGARPGAGRPKGAKAKLTEEAIVRAASKGDGVLPLEFLLEVMRDQNNDQAVRIDAAKAAAPYVHARKLEHSGHMTHDTYVVNAGSAIADGELDAETWRKQAAPH